MSEIQIESHPPVIDAPILEENFALPDKNPAPTHINGWVPNLNPTQQKIFDDIAKFILSYGEKGCRALDTQIYTDTGLKRLGSMAPVNAKVGEFSHIAHRVTSFDGKELKPAMAIGYWIERGTEAVKATLAHGGELIGSPRHPVWVCWSSPDGMHGNKYFKLSEIALLKDQGWQFWTPFFGHPNWTGEWQDVNGVRITESLAYAIGALVGDGGLSQLDSHAGFTNVDPECISAVNSGLADAGLRLSAPHASRTQYSVLPCGSAREFLRALKLEGHSYSKRVPDKIVESPKQVVAAFLSGLFDTDGTSDKIGNIQLCTTSEKLGADVQDLLAAFGILAIRRLKKSASGRPTWTISIHGKHAHRFGREVGFKIKRKQERICKPRVSFRCPSGFNHNRYGYPDPIRRTLRSVALASRTDARKPREGVVHRSREWHGAHRRFHSFGSIPSPEKLQQFCDLYQCRDAVKQFRASDNWIEIESILECNAELADLQVPGLHSFLAAGFINHNSGKSIGGLHALVRHCYEENDALALIIAPQIRTGKEGVIYDLQWVLDIWKNGNLDKDGNRMDEGIGLEYTEPSLDPQTKDRVIFVGNMHGGWSKIILISIPYAEVVQKRMKALSPSFVYVDEVTELSGREYFTYVSAQLGRRRGIKGPQQYVASCNPEGPSHWVYKVFIEEPTNSDTGERDQAFSVYHVAITENKHNLPPGYIEGLIKLFRDPTDYERLIHGRWIDRPSGDSLFRNYFSPLIHVRPPRDTREFRQGQFLPPKRGFPLICGYDPGPVNFSIHFEQMIPTRDGRIIWITFDELNYVGSYTPEHKVVRDLMKRMDHWQTYLGSQASFVHISDEAAFSQIRQDGSYDALRIQQLSGGKIRMRPCPKGKESVPARVNMAIGMLLDETAFISASCPKTIEMFALLASEPAKEGKYDQYVGLRPKRSPYIHPFDSWSYPPFYFTMNPAALSLQTAAAPKREVFRAGGGT